MGIRPCNDDITPIFDWLYLGGVKNIRKTLPFVDVWIDFRCDRRLPKQLTIPPTVCYYHFPFDDGNLDEATPVWETAFQLVNTYRTQGKRIFITCYEGVSRSATLALWIACEELQDYEQALHHVKSRRNIHIDRAFLPFLQELQVMYTSS